MARLAILLLRNTNWLQQQYGHAGANYPERGSLAHQKHPHPAMFDLIMCCIRSFKYVECPRFLVLIFLGPSLVLSSFQPCPPILDCMLVNHVSELNYEFPSQAEQSVDFPILSIEMS